MSRFSRIIEVDEATAAERLTGYPHAFHLRDERRTFLGAFSVEQSSSLDPEEDALLLQQGQTIDPELQGLPRWVGVIPYEASRHWERAQRSRGEMDPRPAPMQSETCWQRYEAVGEVLGEGICVRGESQASVDRLSEALTRAAERRPEPASLRWAEAREADDLHLGRIRVALKRIAEGGLYQVNLARRFRFHATGHAISLLSSLGPLARAPFACALDLGRVQVVSCSPELFLDLGSDRLVTTRPIKGTRPRGASPEQDARLATELDTSEKERAELAMVIDIERNDLGRIAVPGTVHMTEPPAVVTHPTVHHREATVVARLRSEVTRSELFRIMSPSGSVTGAPKVAAMDLICELEAHRRGLYTGALGYLTHGGGARLSMAIRVLSIENGYADYFAGGGIVADSDPAQEVLETLWKAEQLRELVQVNS